MLKIRLQRVGRKHDPSFRVVLTDSKNGPKSGKFLEVLGNYDPEKDVRKVNGERVKELMSQGAQISDTLHNILVSEKVIIGKKINVLPKKSPVVNEKAVAEAKAKEEAEAKAKAEAKIREEGEAKEKAEEENKETEEQKNIETKTEEKIEVTEEEIAKTEEAPVEEVK